MLTRRAAKTAGKGQGAGKGPGAENGHSHNQCLHPGSISDPLPAALAPDLVEKIAQALTDSRCGYWNEKLAAWLQHMADKQCRCGTIGIHCCPYSVGLGEVEYEVIVFKEEVVFRTLQLLHGTKTCVGDVVIAAPAALQSVAVQTEEEEEEREVIQGQAVQVVQQVEQCKKKEKESSSERRIRRLESKKRRRLQGAAAELPLLPFVRKL